MPWIKICGNTNLEDALACATAGADALGFIFAPSPRRVDPQAARKLVAGLPPEVEKIGVFVNETPARIREIAEQVGLTGIQLSGERDRAIVPELAEWRKAAPGRRVILMVPASGEEWEEATGHPTTRERLQIDALLLDSIIGQVRGGTGETFDWTRWQHKVKVFGRSFPIIVAGGLTAENVATAIGILNPFGVDVVSGTEKSPGKKDHDKVRAFVKAAREAKAKEKEKAAKTAKAKK
jgi:phosphoribosylanthranilate isomerase